MGSDTLLEIGPFSRRVGVSPDLLRVWERRYGLLEPFRTVNGRRLYGRADELRVKAMSRALARGLRAAEAARVALAGVDGDGAADDDLPEVAQRLREALDGLDDSRANDQLDRLFAGYSADTALTEVILPYLDELGERWQCGEVGVGHEHFASNLIAGRLLSLTRRWDSGTGERAVLACPPGEQHTIGLLCFGLSLRSHGWRITYLGADTPIDALASVAEALEPSRIVLASARPETLAACRDQLAPLARSTPVAIGGAAAQPRVAAALNAVALTGDPVAEARRLAIGTADDER